MITLCVIVTIGLAIRVGYVLHEQSFRIGGDGFGYYIQSRDIVRGKGFINPFNQQRSALHPPAWSILLAGAYWLGLDTFLRQQLLACALGSITVVLVGLAGRRISGDRAGLIAAGLAALYTGFWVWERPLLSETFLLGLIAATLLVAYAFRAAPSTAKVAGLALLCAVMALTRSEQALVIPLLLAPLLFAAVDPATGRRVATRQRAKWFVLSGAIIVVTILPWTIYNLNWTHKVVLLSDGFGNATRVANCDPVYYGANTGSYDTRCNLHPNDPGAASYAAHHLGRLPLVVVAREGRAWGYWAPFQQTAHDADWQRSPGWVNRLGLFEYWVLVPFAIAGVVVLRRRRVPVYPLLVFIGIVVVTVAITYGETRYRASAEVSIVLLAAVAVDALVPLLVDRRSATNGAPPPQRPEAERDVLLTP